MDPDLQPFLQKLNSHEKVECVKQPHQQSQLKVLFERIIKRDVVGINKFKTQGFDGIFQAHEYGTGNTVLHLVAYKNDLELINFFVEEGAKVNARNMQGITPVMVAAHHGFLEAVKLLMGKRAKLELEDNFGQNILWYCFGGTLRHTQVAAFCLTEGVALTVDMLGKPVFVRACEKGNKVAAIVELFINHGADINCTAKRTGRTGLIEACRRGAVDVIKLLLSRGAAVDLVDFKQVHAAHEAAYHGHISALQLLRGAGAHLDTQTYDGNTPLHLAVSAQQLMCVRFLTQRGSNINQKNALGITPVSLCKKYGLKSAMKEMKKAGRQFSKLGDSKFKLELYDWIQNNTDKILGLIGNYIQSTGMITREDAIVLLQLTEMPITADNRDKFLNLMDPKNSATISAADLISGNKLVSKALRKENFPTEPLNANIKLSNGKKKRTNKKKKPEVKFPKGLKFGISYNANQSELRPFSDSPYVIKHIPAGELTVFGRGIVQPATPFSDDTIWMLDPIQIEKTHVNIVCQLGDWNSLASACNKGFDVNQCDGLYKTPLMYSAIAGRWDMVQLLLAYGANPNLVDNFGWSALHHACRKGQAVVVDELISNGADVNAHSLAGATPLMKAIESNNLNSVLCCIMNGANLRATSVSGLSVQDYARQFGNYRIYRAITRFIKSYRGSRNLTKTWAAIDPRTRFMYGSSELVHEYGKDVRGVFRKNRYLQQKNVLKSLFDSGIPVRAVKSKAVNAVGTVIPNPNNGQSALPPPRIPVSNTGRPWPTPPPPLPVSPHLPSAPRPWNPEIKLVVKRETSASETESEELEVTDPPQQKEVKKERAAVSTKIVKETLIDPKPAQNRQQAQLFFVETWDKFEVLDRTCGQTSNANPADDPKNTFFHEVTSQGRAPSTMAMGNHTELERTAWMLKNHVNLERGGDLTFFAPAPEDWYPPSKEEMVKRYHLQPSLFDLMIQPSLEQDPLTKYVQKAETKLREEQQTKKFTTSVKPTEETESTSLKRFSIPKELKRLQRFHPTVCEDLNFGEAQEK